MAPSRKHRTSRKAAEATDVASGLSIASIANEYDATPQLVSSSTTTSSANTTRDNHEPEMAAELDSDAASELGNGEIDEGSSRSRLAWSAAMEAALLEFLINIRRHGGGGDSGFKLKVFAAAVSPVQSVIAVQSQLPLVTAKRIKNKHTALKMEYRVWRQVVDQSGWTRDPPSTGPVSADLAVMEAYFAAHPRSRKYSEAPIEHETLLDDLFGDVIARGQHAQSFTELSTQIVSEGFGRSANKQGNKNKRRATETGESELETPSASSRQRLAAERNSVDSPFTQRPPVAPRQGQSSDCLMDEEFGLVGKGLVALAASLSADRATQKAAIELAESELREALGTRDFIRLIKKLGNLENVALFVNLSTPGDRKALAEDWINEV